MADPAIFNKKLQYNTLDLNTLYIDVMDPQLIPTVRTLTKRITIFTVTGVYANETDAILALREVKRIIAEKAVTGGNWANSGKPILTPSKSRYIFELPFREFKFISKTEW